MLVQQICNCYYWSSNSTVRLIDTDNDTDNKNHVLTYVLIKVIINNSIINLYSHRLITRRIA